MDVSRKSVATLIDELITTDIRCWMAQDDICDETLTDEKRLAAAVLAQKSNAKRTKLMAAIDEMLGYESGFQKSYDK